MKRIAIFLFSVVLSACGFAQSKDSVKDSLLTDITQRLDRIEFRMRGLDRYKMYKTENIYNLLKLDTSTGVIEQVQWSLDDDNEGSVYINRDPLSYTTNCGTYELYPTPNMYQFILLNKVTGQTWHVQWGTESNKRWIRPIY